MWNTAPVLALVIACGSAPHVRVDADRPDPSFRTSTPEAQGMDSRSLLDLATWIRDHPVPIFSILVSRHGAVVFELYTGSIDREAAHYLMSTTKSFVAALVGIAIDKHLVPGPEVAIADAFPAEAFPSPDDRERFRSVTLQDVLGMSALDTPDPPRVRTPEAIARQHAFLTAPNRARFVLGQPIVAQPGKTFLYTDEGPIIATGMLDYATHQHVLRFAEDNLFGPLGFENYEWMHADPSGIANGGYGLRLRPIDMQKFGVLYLHHGMWNGKQIVPRAWVERTFTPWMRSSAAVREPDYGWFWWAASYGRDWDAHLASGWKGQRIIVIPAQDVVVTMTAYVEDGTERALTARIIEDFIKPAVEHGNRPSLVPDPAVAAALARVLDEVNAGPLRGPPRPEPRMVPSIARKEAPRGAGTPDAPLFSMAATKQTQDNITGKVVVITGGSGGLGAATALLLARRGARLVLGDRDADRLQQLARRIREEHGHAIGIATDVVHREQVNALVSAAVKEFGRIDVMINNAGIAPLAPLDKLMVDDWDRMIDVNIKGVLYGIAAVLPYMRKQKSGHIINIGSVVGHKVFVPIGTVYSATKFAVHALSEGLRAEAPDGVRTTVISPGAVDTGLKAGTSDPETAATLRSFYEANQIPPDAIARAIAYAIEQPANVDVNEIVLRPTVQEF